MLRFRLFRPKRHLIRRIAAALLVAAAMPALAMQPHIRTHSIFVKPGQRIEGIAFPSGTQVVIIDGSGQVSSVLLRTDFRLDGYLLRKGSVLGLQPGEHLGDLFTVNGQVIKSIRFGAGAQIDFDRKVRIDSAHIGHDTRIGRYVYAGNSWVSFYPSNRVKEGELAHATVMGGLHLAPGAVTFYPSGHLASTRLAANSNWHDLVLAGGADSSRIEFWADGKLKQADLAEAATISGVHCQPGTFALFASGHVDGCTGQPEALRIAYTCSNASTLYVSYDIGQRAVIDYPALRHRMDFNSSPHGERYIDDELEWRPPPGEDESQIGTLLERKAGDTGNLIATCRIASGHGHW